MKVAIISIFMQDLLLGGSVIVIPMRSTPILGGVGACPLPTPRKITTSEAASGDFSPHTYLLVHILSYFTLFMKKFLGKGHLHVNILVHG